MVGRTFFSDTQSVRNEPSPLQFPEFLSLEQIELALNFSDIPWEMTPISYDCGLSDSGETEIGPLLKTGLFSGSLSSDKEETAALEAGVVVIGN